MPPLTSKQFANSRDAVYEFRDNLLRLTFEWCVLRSEFYRERFINVINFDGLSDLSKLPVLRREDVVTNRVQLSCCTDAPACVQYTTGTTGSFLPLYRSAAEVSFLSSFYQERLQEVQGPARLRPLYLTLASNYHGMSTPLPAAAYILSAGVYDRTQAQQALNLLKQEYSFPNVERQISAIIGADILVRALTAYLIGRGESPASFGIKRLVITGGYMSAMAKAKLGALWNATIHDRLSMSEIFGGAAQVVPGGPWIFDVEAIPEIVHPRTLVPVKHGVGVLLMTSLYPFSQMTPLIRYYTGDLVEIFNAPGSSDSNLVVNLKGRERRSILDISGSEVIPLILSTDLHDCIDALPDIARSPRFPDLGSTLSMEFAGKLHYSLSAEYENHVPVSISLKLGLRYAPWLFAERVMQIITELRMKLYKFSPALSERVAAGSVKFSINAGTADEVESYNMK
jgi:phenylacetate-coenzyme A ligase PaaK-like adenylate-forming protein